MAKISACIISFNEEKKIEDCLKSLEGIADEIIVVDSLSTDKTVEIASRYTTHIFHQEFLGHIEQKNLAVSKASHEWILSLDCDERLSDELKKSVLAIKEKLGVVDAYQMARKTFYIYRWLNHCWYPDMKVRLFHKCHAKWGGTNPHDKVIVDSSRIGRLKGDILHYSFDSVSTHIQTLEKFSEIGAHEMIKRGKKVTILSPLTHGFWIFFRMYFLKKGFLDGFAGLLASVLSFVHVFVKYSKVLVSQRMRKEKT
ncbi:MAG: glycosyltransferase family 2 protein [Nitrospiria bacterium]